MKIQLKRSNVLENGVAKEPTSGQMEYGELAVNYNSTDPAVFLKNSDNTIIRVDGKQFWEVEETNLYPTNLTNNVLIGGADVNNPAITLSATGTVKANNFDFSALSALPA